MTAPHAALEVYAADADPDAQRWWHAYGGPAGQQWCRVFFGPAVAGPETPGVTDPLAFAEMEAQAVTAWVFVTNGPVEIPARLGPRPALRRAALPWLRSWLAGGAPPDLEGDTAEFVPPEYAGQRQISYAMRVPRPGPVT